MIHSNNLPANSGGHFSKFLKLWILLGSKVQLAREPGKGTLQRSLVTEPSKEEFKESWLGMGSKVSLTGEPCKGTRLRSLARRSLKKTGIKPGYKTGIKPGYKTGRTPGFKNWDEPGYIEDTTGIKPG